MSRRPTCDEDISPNVAMQELSLSAENQVSLRKEVVNIQAPSLNNEANTDQVFASNLTSSDNVISFASGIRIDDGSRVSSRSSGGVSTVSTNKVSSRNYSNPVFCTCDEPVFSSSKVPNSTQSSVMVERAIQRYMNAQHDGTR